ncbi:MAG: 50S ribosomal protein L11 methyltransferase [Rhizobiales bacterium]|nr:50S ribosomal protein L11 methyltransferase [Hyphomicrobiales bacterium]
MAPALGLIRFAGLTLAEASTLSEELETGIDPEPLAVSLNEIDEAAGEWEVLAYFPDETAARIAAGAVDHEGASVSSTPDLDWVRRSLEGLPPISAGRFHLHGSHDRSRRRAGGISLEIDAGTAFGTGHHGTTLGCLRALDLILKKRKPRNILDVGCGTGVLALAAARALHRNVLASDIDPEAVLVTKRNARLNNAGPWVTAIAAAGVDNARIATSGPYDLIFANILAVPLISLAGPLSALSARGGRLILSGLTQAQERAVFAAYRSRGLVRERRIADGNWMTLVLKHPA